MTVTHVTHALKFLIAEEKKTNEMWGQHRSRQLSTCVLNPTVICRTKYGTRTTICITPYFRDMIESLSKPCEEELNIYTKTKCLIVLNLISSIPSLYYAGPKLVHLRHISFLSCPTGQAIDSQGKER